jgi:hypothetical protein
MRCYEVCPPKVIDFDIFRDEEHEVKASSIILSTGFELVDALIETCFLEQPLTLFQHLQEGLPVPADGSTTHLASCQSHDPTPPRP